MPVLLQVAANEWKQTLISSNSQSNFRSERSLPLGAFLSFLAFFFFPAAPFSVSLAELFRFLDSFSLPFSSLTLFSFFSVFSFFTLSLGFYNQIKM
jgi:hypothetical protein